MSSVYYYHNILNPCLLDYYLCVSPKGPHTWPMQWGKLLVALVRTFNRGSNLKAHRTSLLHTVTQNAVSSGYQGAFLSPSQAIEFGFEKAFDWIYTRLEDNSGSQGESKLTFRMIPKVTSFYHTYPLSLLFTETCQDLNVHLALLQGPRQITLLYDPGRNSMEYMGERLIFKKTYMHRLQRWE